MPTSQVQDSPDLSSVPACPGVSTVEWSVREELALSSAVLQCGNQAWSNVSQLVRLFADSGRPADWCSAKNCAKQYAKVLDSSEAKRNRNDVSSFGLPWCELVVKRLTVERIEELFKSIQREEAHYKRLKSEITAIESGRLDNKVVQMWEELKRKENLTDDDDTDVENIAVKEEIISCDEQQSDEQTDRSLRTKRTTPGGISIQHPMTWSNKNANSGTTGSVSVNSTDSRLATRQPPSMRDINSSSILDESWDGRRTTRQSRLCFTNARSPELPVQPPIKPLLLYRSPVLSRFGDLASRDQSAAETDELWERVECRTTCRDTSPTNSETSNATCATTAMTLSSESTVVATGEVLLNINTEIDDDQRLTDVEEALVDSVKTPEPSKTCSTKKKTRMKRSPLISARRSLRSAGIPADIDSDVLSHSLDSWATASSNTPTNLLSLEQVSNLNEELLSKSKHKSCHNSPELPSTSPELHSKSPESRSKSSPESKSSSTRKATSKQPTSDEPPSMPLLLKLQREHEVSGEVRYRCSFEKNDGPRVSKPKSEEDLRLWKKAIGMFLQSILTHRHSAIFCYPIKNDVAVDYSSVVLRPMDLITLKRRVESGEVNTTIHFIRDLMFVFTNAIMYNCSDHLVHEMAVEMFNDVMKTVEKCLSQQTIDPYVSPMVNLLECPSMEECFNLRKRKLSTDSEVSSHGSKSKRV